MRPINKDAVVELSEKVSQLSAELHDFNALLSHEQRALHAEERAAAWSARKQLAVKSAKFVGNTAYSVVRGACRVALYPFKRSKAVDVSEMSREQPKAKKTRTRRAKAIAPVVVEPVTA